MKQTKIEIFTLSLPLRLLFFLLSVAFLNSALYAVVSDTDSSDKPGIGKEKKKTLDSLLNLHYKQQPADGHFDYNFAKKFDLRFAKAAYQICMETYKFDTLQALAIDIGYISELREEYDSAFTYYFNTLSFFEEADMYEKTFSLTQNILYNNNDLYKIIEADKIEQSEQNKKILYLFIATIVFLLVIVLLTVFFYRKVSLKNHQISWKNKNLEYAQSQIKSSLDYAQNIQNSILQNEIGLTKSFSDSFVLFKPKDTVSGDFLWTNKSEDFIFIAVADCTGHGVPGALLTIVGNFLLDATVNYHQLRNTNEILDKLDHEVIVTLNKNSKNRRSNGDGMDIALLRIDVKNRLLQFSGANRSVYVIRNGEIIELKGDRRPVGETMVKYNAFQYQSFQLQSNDNVYSFSDGYYDQFNEDGKKFLKKNLLKLLTDNCKLDLQKQCEILENTFIKHQGSTQQIDDVLVIGIKI